MRTKMDMMTHALELASAAAQAGEVPVGAVITDSWRNSGNSTKQNAQGQ